MRIIALFLLVLLSLTHYLTAVCGDEPIKINEDELHSGNRIGTGYTNVEDIVQASANHDQA